MVKVAKAEKRADVLNRGQCRPVFDARNFDRVHASHPPFKDYPQVIDTWGMEDTFLWLEVEVVIQCDLKNVGDCRYMSGMSAGWRYECFGGDCYVVHVDSNRGAQQVVLRDGGVEDLVHKGLECSRRITKSEIHHRWFEQAPSCFECGLVFIASFDTYVVVSLTDVELGKYGCAAEIADEVSNKREGVLISDRPRIDLPVVLYQSQFPIFLFDEEKG
jgi:hypothetical protein